MKSIANIPRNLCSTGRFPSGRWRETPGRAVIRCLLCMVLCSVTGCGGCFRDRAAPSGRKAGQKKPTGSEDLAGREKKKPDFEVARITLQPSDESSFLRAVKPGHWTGATQEMKANNFDFVGDLEISVLDNAGRPIPLPGTPFRLTTTRPVALYKGQSKRLEMVFFAPHVRRTTGVATVLRARGGSREILPSREFFSAMPAHQYLFVVLARQPDRYAYLKVLDSVRAPWEDELSFQPIVYYEVVAPRIGRRAPLPAHALAWTSIAYVLWDDLHGSTLTESQQSALIDWLHWGGQLIVSGPDSIEALRGSFLAPYLPVTGGTTCEISAADLQPINDHWTLADKGRAGTPLATTDTWLGVSLALHPEATLVPGTGRLLAERQVGRGRIVVSAFRLSARPLIHWKSFDSFFNACLLGRPRRRYVQSASGVDLRLGWADYLGREFDARMASGLRYFTRDTYLPRAANRRSPRTTRDGRDGNARPGIGNAVGAAASGAVAAVGAAADSDRFGGVASWNTRNDAARAARQLLRKAAGITIPRASFVASVLVIYLLVLVPLNYGVCRALGRVEWAWIAAPLIALVGAGAVVRLAQLDIGFARSETEIGVLEAHAGYRRGHLTRYTALYTSLSTSYELEFEDPSALAQPFPADADFQLVSGQMRSTVTYARHQTIGLRGLRVDSNTTGMVHSEQMFDMGGALSIETSAAGPTRVVNGTRLHLADVLVVRKRVPKAGPDRYEMCTVGALEAGATAPLTFRPAEWAAAPNRPADRPAPPDGAAHVALDDIRQLALSANLVAPGEVRLVGRIDGSLPGLKIHPGASQVRAATLVVVHLVLAERPLYQPDVNTRVGPHDAAPPERPSEMPEQ